ncbi:MAG: zinc-dependent metalloprotease [Actinomycetota bacterium]
MDNPFPPGGDPDAFKDAPLFRELQRIMQSSSGPVNWELARQAGIAAVVEAGDDPEPDPADLHSLQEAVRVAEIHVARSTGLEPPTELADVQPVRRTAWVNANTESLRAVMEPAAGRMADALERAGQGAVGGEGEGSELAGLGGMLAQMGPILQGTQIGSVLGFLAQHVMGQYDIAVPRGGDLALLFVAANISKFERDWSLEPTEFRTFLAIHEVTHRFEFARPWTTERFARLVDDYLSGMTIDLEGVQSRLASLDPGDPGSVERALGGEALFGPVMDDEQRLKLARIQAFMATAEGYSEHVMHGVGSELLSTYDRIQEAMRRYRESESGDPIFERLLGVEMRREQYEAGRAFCDEVAAKSDEATLARMWDSADAMPSLPEINEPVLWLSRTV